MAVIVAQRCHTGKNAGQSGGTATTTITPVYDPDGNLLDDGRFQYAWDAEHRLISATPGDTASGLKKATFQYDYLSRRIQKTTSTYTAGAWTLDTTTTVVYDGWNVIQETTTTGGATSTAQYVWGLDLSGSLKGAGGIGGLLLRKTDTGTFAYLYDANGNVGQLINVADGSLAARYEYDAFGNLLVADGPEADNNPYRYSTKYFIPEIGWYDYGYRYYAPELGRWPTRDPIGEKGGLNLYGFVGNNPLTFVDPVGFSAEDGSWQQQLLNDLKQSLLNAYWGQVDALWNEFSNTYTSVDTTHGLMPSLLLPILNQLMYDVADFQAREVFPCLQADPTSRDYQVGYYGTALLIFLASLQSGGGAGDLAEESEVVDLYRFVSPDEFDDIAKTGKFRFALGQMEVKQFGFDFDETLRLSDHFSDAAAIVKAKIPKRILNNFDRTPVDRHIFKSGTITIYGQELLDILNDAIVEPIKHVF